VATPTYIIDPRTGNKATVTKFGQMVTSPIDYSTPKTVEMTVINTPYVLIEPVEEKAPVVTTFIMTANKAVGTNDATISVYAADTFNAPLPTEPEIKLELAKNSQLALSGLNLLLPEGKFILAQTNDNTIFLTIGFYRVPVERNL
jgi:hypothetical protein